MKEFLIAHNAWFDPHRCLNSGQVFRFSLLEGVTEGWIGSLYLRVESSPHHWMIRSNESREAVENLFSLDRDAEEIERKAALANPRVAAILGEHRGLRSLRSPSFTETVFSFICSANNNVPRIRQMVAALAARRPGGAFPAVEDLATVPESDWRASGFGYRAKSIEGTARLLASDPGFEVRVRGLGGEEQLKELVSLPGVGPKVACCIALIGLDNRRAVPVDVHIWRGLNGLYFPGTELPTFSHARATELVAKFTEDFGDDAGWVHQFLFLGGMLKTAAPA